MINSLVYYIGVMLFNSVYFNHSILADSSDVLNWTLVYEMD